MKARLLMLIPLSFVFFLLSCGSGGNTSTQEAINALEFEEVKKVNTESIEDGVHNAKKISKKIDSQISLVEAANRKLEMALKDKDATHEKQRELFRIAMEAINEEQAERFRDIEEGYERRRMRYVVLASDQRSEIIELNKLNKELSILADKLEKDKNELLYNLAINREVIKNNEKKAEATVAIVNNLEKKNIKLEKWKSKNQWIVNGFYFIFVIFGGYMLIRVVMKFV